MAAVQTDFLRGVTHDLQTPLTSIRALAAELRSSPGSRRPGADDLETITHQADRLRRMVGQLLVASRAGGWGRRRPGRRSSGPGPSSTATWSALRAARPSWISGRRTRSLLVVGDPDRFEQVLWALLDNAVKYSPAGHAHPCPAERARGRRRPTGAIRARVTRSATRDLGWMRDAEHAFEQFYRAPDAQRLAPDGSGVGLYAASGLVEAMGGRSPPEPALGSGTSVRIELPAEAVPLAGRRHGQELADGSPKYGGGTALAQRAARWPQGAARTVQSSDKPQAGARA